jgi:hypothetical protein
MQIKVGETVTASFIPFDQNNMPNPVGPDGAPLWPIPPITWSLDFPAGRKAAGLFDGAGAPTGITLVPSADGNTCAVTGDVENTVLALYVTGDRGDGQMVRGGHLVEVIPADGVPTSVIAYLQIQFAPAAA